MKKGIHPENYRVVVFKDMSDGTQFSAVLLLQRRTLSKSTAFSIR